MRVSKENHTTCFNSIFHSTFEIEPFELEANEEIHTTKQNIPMYALNKKGLYDTTLTFGWASANTI